MKILAIRIKNLASLEGDTEIDFTAEPLCSAGIFAITGATGAGKSTILDALCLALYGKTPRYLDAREAGIELQDVQGSTLSQGDVRGILRDGTADGFAEVDFRGIDEQDYRANWSVRRARNKSDGSMQSDNITLKNISANTDIPGRKQETLNEIARLVGLNFDQFTRSVLLAQGDFTAFMKANKDEKSSLLEKLTGTHIYSEISKKIYEKYKVEEQQLRELHLRKEGIITLTEEELNSLLAEQDVLATQIKGLDKEIEKLTAEIVWHEQMAKLQAGYNDANTALQRATEAKTMASPRKQKLLVAEHAQQTRSWADALKHAQQQHTDKTSSLTALKETIGALQKQKEKLQDQLAIAETALANKNKALTDALPLFEQGRKLDTLLAEKKEQLKKLKEDADNAAEINSGHQKLLAEKQAAFASLCAEIKTLADWNAENKARSAIAENKDLILSKLQDAQKLLENLQSSTKELDELADKIKANETQKTAIETNWQQQLQGLDALKKSYDARTKELVLIPIEALNADKTETERQVENTIKAQANWQLFYRSLTELEALSQQQIQDQSDYKIKLETFQKLAQQLLVENAEKETAAQLLQQARLASAENVETLRDALVDEEPCPVCGSTSHPYVLHNPQLENVLAQLEKTHLDKERVYLSSYRLHNALEQECSTLQQSIKRRSEDIGLKQTALEAQKQTWLQFDIAQESHAVADAEKADWIAEKLKALKIKQADLLAQIQAHAKKKQQQETDKIKIDALKETTDGLANQIKDIGSNLSVYREQQGSKTKAQNKATAELGEVEKTLSPYFTASGWMENWKTAPTAFVERIDAFAQKWKENTVQLEQLTHRKAALEATLKELENQAKSLLVDVTKKREAYAAQNNIHLDLTQQRNAIFEGKPVAEVEAELKQAITEAQQRLEQLKETRQQLTIDATKAHTQSEELTAALITLDADAKTASQKIQDWLSDYNLKNNLSISLAELHELLALSNDWMDAERRALQAIEEAVTKAGSVVAERKQSLDDHQQKSLSERLPDELHALIADVKADAEQQKHKKGEIAFRLQQDEANKNKIGDLLKSIAAQAAIAENWSKLNEMIGSADGKKFRQIAQEYTLDVLLGYTNIHLQVLTNRYKMERIPATLGLQVVDHDMGDEVRTVYSLSGGESFLVSLALALGLSSLSSSRMKVESLFIDEGFGSLDPTTLNIAMDALERLHNQGRKVGVISHVQEMTERIPVQIKVSKQQSGRSLVEVMGV